jgi:uncharacterized SAM-binding protein YcdF (DUF218 family)
MNTAFLHVLLGQILLPPVNLVLLVLLCCALPQRWAGLRRWGALLCATLLLVLTLPVTSNLLFGGLERGVALRDPSSADISPSGTQPAPQAIVILGGDNSTGRAQGGILNGVRAGALSVERARAGAVLYRRTGLPVLVTGGALSASHPPVAALMADILRTELSVPVRWEEIQAGTTWENAEYSAALLKRNGISSVYVVTQAWHMRRALMAFRRFGLTAWPAPVDLDVLKPQTKYDFIPTANALLDSYYAFHEWIGCAYYALRS